MSSESSKSALSKGYSVPTVQEVQDVETTSLLGNGAGSYQTCSHDESDSEAQPFRPQTETKSVTAMLSVLYIGVFISQVDTSLVLATYGKIASEFHDLQNASWLVSIYMLAMCIGQPLYGKLSDIFGRKAMVQVSYALFAIGSAFCGTCQSMPQLIAARAVQGLGSGGMVTLVAIIIIDLVPLRDVAAWRSYVNVVQTAGRSSGGAIGGLLSQIFGWRWTLSGQAPFVMIAMVLIWWKLDVPSPDQNTTKAAESFGTKVKRIDFLGAFFLSVTTTCFLLVVDLGGNRFAWTSTTILVLVAASAKSAIAFFLVEKKWAKEPIFPLRLFKRYVIVASYFIISLQNASQTALIFLVPLYFQITYSASTGQAGLYMIPAIAGNTIGSLLAGIALKRYGRTKALTILATVFSAVCYASLLLFWNGTGPPGWMSILIFPGGFAVGISHAVLFVTLAASVSEGDMAIAGSAQYLCGTIGSVVGICAANAALQAGLGSALHSILDNSGIPNAAEIIRKCLSDITYVQELTGTLRELVVDAYVSGFHDSFTLCLVMAVACFLVAITTKNCSLSGVRP